MTIQERKFTREEMDLVSKIDKKIKESVKLSDIKMKKAMSNIRDYTITH